MRNLKLWCSSCHVILSFAFPILGTHMHSKCYPNYDSVPPALCKTADNRINMINHINCIDLCTVYYLVSYEFEKTNWARECWKNRNNSRDTLEYLINSRPLSVLLLVDFSDSLRRLTTYFTSTNPVSSGRIRNLPII